MKEAPKKKELCPKIREGVDLVRLSLSSDEALVISRLDGMTKVSELALILQKPEGDVRRVLERLAKVGVVDLDGSAAASGTGSASLGAPRAAASAAGRSAVAPPSPDATTYGNFVFPPVLMEEVCDLSSDERKRILWFFEHLDTWNHYELLRVRRRDDAKAIKRAYFERSKEWHPDRFRRPNLGSFKKRIEAIFLRVQQAYQELSDPKVRESYDAKTVFAPDEEELAEMLARQRKLEREALREKEAVERRRRSNPLRRRVERAKNFYQEALKLRDEGDPLGALRAIQTANTFDKREDYQALEDELKILAGELRLGPYMKRGLREESMTNWVEAIDAFQGAVDVAPEYGPARLRLAYNLLMCGRGPQEANPHAQKALQLMPNDPEAHFVLGLCYEKGGMEKAAVRAFSRALELKPNYADAKKRLKRLRWGF